MDIISTHIAPVYLIFSQLSLQTYFILLNEPHQQIDSLCDEGGAGNDRGTA